ncbi:MAG: YraN family protein [Candidatus Paceibacterota bacterium]|jgi:putative endonuclease
MFGKKEQKPPTEKQIIGKIGEDAVSTYLKENGYSIIDRNYLRKWGELDIVAKKGNKIHFVEVKSVSRLLGGSADEADQNVTRVTDDYRPEDNMHPWKLKRLGRAIQSYLLDKNVSDDIDWQFDVAIVYMDENKKPWRVSILDDVVL